MIRTVFVACVVLSAVLSSATRAAAQDGVTLSGRLLNSLSGDPIPGVVVVIEELAAPPRRPPTARSALRP